MNPYAEVAVKTIPQDFVQWWEPYMEDQVNGASIGGHVDARRIWARKDDRGWTRRTYGLPTRIAFITDSYVSEYEAWKAVGSPARLKDFMSISEPLEKQKQLWSDLKNILLKAKKPVQEITQTEDQLLAAKHVGII